MKITIRYSLLFYILRGMLFPRDSPQDWSIDVDNTTQQLINKQFANVGGIDKSDERGPVAFSPK